MTVPALSLIVTNVRIPTGNPDRPWATALGIRDGKLAVVGSAAEILKMADTETRVIDAGGKVLTLPSGTVVGSSLTVTVAHDGRPVIHSSQEGA